MDPTRGRNLGSLSMGPVGSGGISAGREWLRTVAAREAMLLLGGGAVVQTIMRWRFDEPAHTVGGGAALLMIAGLVPSRLAVRAGRWSALGLFGLLVCVAWLLERFVFGPFDLVDFAFTLAGGLLVFDAVPEVVDAPSHDRKSVVVTAVILIVTALGYRYGMSLGAA